MVVRGMFSPAEIEVLRTAVENDRLVSSKHMPMKDASGKVSKVTLWSHITPTTYGDFAAGRRMVHAARKLMMGEEPTHFHTKIMLKEPRQGGAWNVHQE